MICQGTVFFKKLKIKLLCLLGITVFLSSCGYKSVKEDRQYISQLSDIYQRLGVESTDQETYIRTYKDWYRSFYNPEFNLLVQEALVNNSDLKMALLNLKATAANLGQERSALLPSLSVGAQKSTTHFSQAAKDRSHGGVTKDDSFSIGLSANYELDIWGKNYAAYRAGLSKLRSTAEQLNAVQITVVTSCMNLWIDLMSLRETQDVLKSQIKRAKTLLSAQEAGFGNSDGVLSNLLQQKTKILNLQDKLAEAKYAEKSILRSLNILLGKDPLSNLYIVSRKLPKVSPLPDRSISMETLGERPDIKESFLDMISSKWQAKAASLSRLPSVSLSANLQFPFVNIQSMLDVWILNLAANIAMPIFKAGALKGKADAAKYLSNAQIVNYKSTVLKAVNECVNALDNEAKFQAELKSQDRQINFMEMSLSSLLESYLNGSASYTDWLVGSEQLDSLRLSRINAQKDFLLNRVLFYKSLGIPIKVTKRAP